MTKWPLGTEPPSARRTKKSHPCVVGAGSRPYAIPGDALAGEAGSSRNIELLLATNETKQGRAAGMD
jgi:hypothetical protein